MKRMLLTIMCISLVSVGFAGADRLEDDLRGLKTFQLLQAAKEGDLQAAKTALDEGANVNSCEIYINDKGNLNIGETALMLAARKGNTDIVKLLLDKGADVNAKTDIGETALMWATRYNNTEIVKILLEKGADINVGNNDGETAVEAARKMGYTDIVQLLEKAVSKETQSVKSTLAEGAQSSVAGKPSVNSQTSKILLISGPIFNSRDAAIRFRPSAIKILEITEKQAFLLPEGTTVTVLSGNSDKKQVRILEGAHKNEMFWVFTPFLQPEDVILIHDANSKSVLVWEDADWDPRKDNPDSYIGFRSQSETDVKSRLFIGLLKHGAGKATVPFGTKAKWVGGDSKFAKVQVCEGYYKDKTVGTLTESVTIPIGVKATLRGSPETAPFTDAVPTFKTEQSVDSAISIASDVVTIINKEGGYLLQNTKAEILRDDGTIKKVKILTGEHAGNEGWIAIEQIRTQMAQKQSTSSYNKEESSISENVNPKQQSLNLLPSFSEELQGSNPVRVKNPNSFAVSTGIRAGQKGVNFDVPADGTQTVYVPNGKYDIYFVYSDRPDALFQGDSFILNNNGVEIQIVQIVNGNYNIRKVK